MSTPFQAIADSTRRSILEQLRLYGPLSLSEISRPLPITRQAVSKHLKALETSGLVRARRSGRERIHVLNAEPLRELRAWLAPYEEEWDRRLERLEHHLGENP